MKRFLLVVIALFVLVLIFSLFGLICWDRGIHFFPQYWRCTDGCNECSCSILFSARKTLRGCLYAETEAATLLSFLSKRRGVPEYERISFYPSGYSGNEVSEEGIFARSGLKAEDKVCLSLGELEKDASFSVLDGKIVYSGSESKPASVIAICDIGKEMIPQNYLQNYTNGIIKQEWVKDCSCINKNFDNTCCVVTFKESID